MALEASPLSVNQSRDGDVDAFEFGATSRNSLVLPGNRLEFPLDDCRAGG
jgi:hypothetical protein